ncbi:MAG: DUF5659 domain-containing protein [Candidatus Omnitrophota bacterium]|jgi:hypothetical protein
MTKSKHHATPNLYEASFLIARGFKINDIEKDAGRKAILYLEGEGIEDAIRDYYNGGLVSGKAMTDAYRMLKDRVFE